jgi:hypothetical protein
MNDREQRRLTEFDGAAETVKRVTEALREHELKPEGFSIRELAEAVIPDGREYVNACDPRKDILVSESFDGVDVTAFLNITGQIVFTKIKEAFQMADFVCSRIVQTIPTRFNGEKIPSVQNLDQPAGNLDEVMPGMRHRGCPQPRNVQFDRTRRDPLLIQAVHED